MSESGEFALELEEEEEEGEGQGQEVEQGEGEVLLMHVRTAEDKVKDIKYIKSLSARAVARKSAAIKVLEERCIEIGVPYVTCILLFSTFCSIQFPSKNCFNLL